MPATRQARTSPTSTAPELRVRRLDALYDAERAFVHLYGESENAFWLDSAGSGPRARFSFMGDSGGPLGVVVTYDVESGQVRVQRGGEVELRYESIFGYLGRELRRMRHLSGELPFDFDCGFVGYLGYELKAECDGSAVHRASTPDAAFVFADRLMVFDHQECCTYLVCLLSSGQPPSPELHQAPYLQEGEFDPARVVAEGKRWIEETSRCLESLPPLGDPELGGSAAAGFRLRRSRRRYLEDIATCKRYLAAGHSYEICLTNKVVAEADPEPLELYRALRRANPAPFAAYLRFGDLAVLSSSPERFLAVDRRGWAESRPIKGTSRRGGTAEEDAHLAQMLGVDEKNRAENVTVVDLVRNDLGRVCEVGTVSVPELMRIESYETVHQLVSSVRGRLRDEVSAPECVRACFPPGSMTGAPKLRTMEIIDDVEGEARGVYSGAIGYFGLGGGCDLSVAIRTIVGDRTAVTIGTGGAIVVQSDPEGEFDEILLKAEAQISAFCPVGLHAPLH